MTESAIADHKDWALILSQAVDAFRIQALRPSVSGSYTVPSDLVTAFALQLRQWRETALADPASRNKSDGSPGEGHFEVYESYAWLVVQSLALQFAQDHCPSALPSTFSEASQSRISADRQYQGCAMHLIEKVKTWRRQHFTRSVPDYYHSALTYGATSLLRCTQARFAHLQPDRPRIFELARTATALLAEAAIDSDHIAAMQSALISKLVALRDVNVIRDSQSVDPIISPIDRHRPLEAINLNDFTRENDTGQAPNLWSLLFQGASADGQWCVSADPSFEANSDYVFCMQVLTPALLISHLGPLSRVFTWEGAV